MLTHFKFYNPIDYFLIRGSVRKYMSMCQEKKLMCQQNMSMDFTVCQWKNMLMCQEKYVDLSGHKRLCVSKMCHCVSKF